MTKKTPKQVLAALKRYIRHLEQRNSILEARVARLELEAQWAAEDAAGASL
jgi:hypothetical protein